MGGARMQRQPINQMDIDQASITNGQSATTAAEPHEIKAQLTLLALQSLANSSSLKSIVDDDAHSIADSDVSVLSHVNTPPVKSGFMNTQILLFTLKSYCKHKLMAHRDHPSPRQSGN
jgi:hypothetical protein